MTATASTVTAMATDANRIDPGWSSFSLYRARPHRIALYACRMTNRAQHHLLYDGECDFCRAWASWLTLRDGGRRFRICPWQVAPSPPMTPALQIQAQRAVQVVTAEGKRWSGGSAILFVLRETGWHPRLMRLLQHRPCIWLIDGGYRLVAANRSRLSWLVPH